MSDNRVRIGGSFPIQLQAGETVTGTNLGAKILEAIDDAVASARKLNGDFTMNVDLGYEVWR